MKLQPVIGLEIHVELKTKSKMFCSCSAHVSAHTPPNTNTCPICLGHPGTLPVLNAQAVRFGVLLGLALEGTVASHCKFDRKNYFYPDLPKGYQISQYDQPIVSGGHVDVEVPGAEQRKNIRIGITRAHLEEDAAKNIHAGTTSLVDFNRAGVPLLEIVTEPDFCAPEEAKAFLQELRLLVRTLGISDGDMEKGHMRCDANVSLRELDEDGNVFGPLFHPKTEIKNINSFRNVERALKYEITRQTALWESGARPMITTTRGFDDTTGKTVEQRTKEDAADYRFFPEPDLPPLELDALVEEMRPRLPELPAVKRRRFVDEYGFTMPDARQLIEDPALAEFAEHTISELGGWLESQGNVEPEGVEAATKKLARLVASWLLNKLLGLMNEQAIDVRTMKIDPENFAEFITLVAGGKVTNASGLKILQKMLESGADPTHIMEDVGLGKMEDTEAVAAVVDRVLAAHPQEVARYKAGEVQLLKLFIGLVMKETEGSADPGSTKNILAAKLAQV